MKELKVLAINGSPHAEGGTFQAINIVAKELEKQGIKTEILQIGNKAIRGCQGCGTCKKASTNGLCVFNDDEVNIAIEKMKNCDNCKHSHVCNAGLVMELDRKDFDEPCNKCKDYSKWEIKNV